MVRRTSVVPLRGVPPMIDVSLRRGVGPVPPAVLPDAGDPVVQVLAEAHAAESSQIVIGPSLTSSTAISAPNTPRATGMPRAATASA